MSVTLQKSSNATKKYMVIIDGKKTVHFGARGYSDYTIHHDAARKLRYIARHKNNENWNDINTAGFWSRWILWNLPSFNASVHDTEKRFNLKIKVIS